MRQAVCTKYLSPTNHRGARVKAYAQAGSVTIPWDYALSTEENHREAALQLIEKFGWERHGHWTGGALPSGDGYCFVCPM